MATKNTKIAQLLLSRGISSRDVVKSTGLNKAHISVIKNGYQNITMATLKKLCIFFKCTPNDILDYQAWFDEAEKKAAVKKETKK